MATGMLKREGTRHRVVIPANSNVTLTVISDWDINLMIYGNGTILSTNGSLMYLIQGYATASRCTVTDFRNIPTTIFEIDNSDTAGKTFVLKNKEATSVALIVDVLGFNQSISVS